MNLYLLTMPSRREWKVERRLGMHTGRLIDELIETVERVETQVHQQASAEELEHWYPVAPYQLGPAEANLLGVA
jgi:hypothetical protein